jgi:YggT family protein
MNPFIYLIETIIELAIWIVIASAIMSWLVAFGVVNTRNQFIRMVVDFLYRISEPMLRPIRRMVPNLGGVDISPVILLLGLYAFREALRYYLYPILLH